MSMVVQYFIQCNGCRDGADIGDDNRSPAAARAAAKREGYGEFKVSGKRGARHWHHYCPACMRSGKRWEEKTNV